MSAIRLIHDVPSSTAPAAVFQIRQGSNQIAHLEVHGGAQASVPAIVVDENNGGYVNTAQEWVVYAIINGITTASVTIADPNATVTLREDNAGGFSLTAS